jgi:ketosteroid isomerase-like protein
VLRPADELPASRRPPGQAAYAAAMGLIEDLVARLDRVEAELALHRLAYDYCIGADHRDLARWQQVWASDGVWETSPDRTYRGAEQITAAVTAQWQAFPVMQHSTVNHVVDVAGETATGRCDVVVQVQLGDGRWIVGGGAYEDEYRREAGRWRISCRRVARPSSSSPPPHRRT